MHRFDPIAPSTDADYVRSLCGRVSSSLDEGLLPVEVFNDDRLFRAEMERIFTRTWVFVAHETELPSNGDFVMRKIGLDKVIVCRDDTGVVRVLSNHCRHRGTEICHEDRGNASTFKCPYHGWVYKNDGDWMAAPQMQDAYGGRLDAREWGLLRAPKVDSVHGFIFASLSEDVPSLSEYLGGAEWMLDAIMGLHPGGMRVLGPPEVFTFKADWKSGAENFGGDAYHVGTTHWSVTLAEFIPGLNAVSSFARGYCFENGHSFIGHALPELIAPPFSMWGYPPQVREQFDLSKLDETQIAMINDNPPTIGNIFPNFSYLRFPQPSNVNRFPITFTNIKMWQPVAPGVMELWNWQFEYDFVPDEYKAEAYLAGQYGFGSGGIFEMDDTTVWEGITKGGRSPWNRMVGAQLNYQQKRGGADPTWGGPGEYHPSVYGEYQQERFWRQWHKMMTENDTTTSSSTRLDVRKGGDK
jgi:N,N-dimethyl phenylurea N-demethylase alpha subunit